MTSLREFSKVGVLIVREVHIQVTGIYLVLKFVLKKVRVTDPRIYERGVRGKSERTR